MTQEKFYVINNGYFVSLSSVSVGGARSYWVRYIDKITGKRPVFVYVSKEDNGKVRSGISDEKT